MPQFQRISLVHYHELGLKGHNRSAFEKRLMYNVRTLLEGAPVEKVTRISGRILTTSSAKGQAGRARPSPCRRSKARRIHASYA